MTYQHTSREAWQSFLPVSAKLDRSILDTLSEHGAMTDQEIEALLDRDHQAVSANRRHLVEKGLVEDSGERGKTRSGRSAIKWRLTTFAQSPAGVPFQ